MTTDKTDITNIDSTEASVELEKAKETIDAEGASPRAEPFYDQEIAEIRKQEKRKPYIFFKALIDWLLSLIAIIILIVPFIFVSIISFISDPGPIFFRQTRCGRNGKPFKMIKFRTMKRGVIHQHVSAQALSTEDYMRACNKWQRLMRKTSIDELPQVFNVFLFQMAWIGPRPLVYNERIVHEERIKNGSIHCRPGLSGLAQTSGRREVDYIEKGELDGKYYANMSLWLDIKLWFKTVGKVFKHEGAE